MSTLEAWIQAALHVADSEGMPDSEVIPTWPPDVSRHYPALTVGALREWQAGRAHGGERTYPVHQKCGTQLKGRHEQGQQVTCPGCRTHGEAVVDDGGVDFFRCDDLPNEWEGE